MQVSKRTDISPQYILDLLLLETTPDHQSSATVHTTAGSQFSKQELHDVVVGPLHPFADINDIGKNGSPIAFAQTLRGGNLVGLGSAGEKIGMMAVDKAEETSNQHRIWDGLGGVVLPDAGAVFKVVRNLFCGRLLFRGGLLRESCLGKLGFEIALRGLLRAFLLFLFHHRWVELAIFFAISGIGIGIGVGIFGFLRLLLLRKALEHFRDFVDLLVRRC